MLRRDVGELAVAVSAHSFSTCVDCQSASGLAAVSGKARKGSHNSSLPRIHFPFDQCSTLAWSPEVRPTRKVHLSAVSLAQAFHHSWPCMQSLHTVSTPSGGRRFPISGVKFPRDLRTPRPRLDEVRTAMLESLQAVQRRAQVVRAASVGSLHSPTLAQSGQARR